MNKHLQRLGRGSVFLLCILGMVAILMGIVGLAVYYPWTGFISGALGFIGLAYFAGIVVND